MRLVFLGPPGVGKGTQAENVCKNKNIAHVSSGNLLRDAVDAKTEVGLKASEYIEKGLLVPDELVVKIVVDTIATELCKSGFVLDGFPRNQSQAEILDKTLKELGEALDKVLYFTAFEDVIIERISGRRICKACATHYHEKHRPPVKSGVCDKCGSALDQRKDDKPETISVRLKVYREQTEGLIDYYRNNNLLIEVNCNGDIPEIQETIHKELSS